MGAKKVVCTSDGPSKDDAKPKDDTKQKDNTKPKDGNKSECKFDATTGKVSCDPDGPTPPGPDGKPPAKDGPKPKKNECVWDNKAMKVICDGEKPAAADQTPGPSADKP